jgi:hypothetical protein
LGDSHLQKALSSDPAKPAAKQDITRYSSRLLQTLEDFLAIESLLQRKHLKGQLIAEHYFTIQHHQGLSKSIRQNQKTLDQEAHFSSFAAFHQYLNQKLAHNHEKQLKNLKASLAELSEAGKSLDQYYALELLQAAVSFTQLKAGNAVWQQFPLLNSILTYIDEHQQEMPPLLILWKYAFILSIEPKDQLVFEQFKTNLLAQLHHISQLDALNFNIILNNALNQQLPDNQERYFKERHDLYEIEIREGWLLAHGSIGWGTFNNIITCALALEKIQYAADFLADFQQYLLPETREQVVRYNEARIDFARGNLEESLQKVLKTEYLDTSISLGLRRLHMMILFELKEWDALANAGNALKMYLYRTEDLKIRQKEQHRIFNRIIILLSTIPFEQDSAEKSMKEVNALLQGDTFIPDLLWLERKAKQIQHLAWKMNHNQ